MKTRDHLGKQRLRDKVRANAHMEEELVKGLELDRCVDVSREHKHKQRMESTDCSHSLC